MQIPVFSDGELEDKIGELLDTFCKRRIERLGELKLNDTLRKKNPYLFKATGVQEASEIVKQLLMAYASSSDEGIFGDIFFEPLAKYVCGGQVAPSEGIDIAMEDDTTYRAIAVKSGPNVFNAQSKRRQLQDFTTLENRIRKLRKLYDPIIGYAYGRKRPKNPGKVRELAGQAFWQEITGNPDFYLKIIDLMKDKPLEHLTAYKDAWDATLNRFTRDFTNDFCLEDGHINWGKLTEFNSGIPKQKETKKAKGKTK